MLKIKLEALEHPNPASVDVKDRKVFASTVLWLEDQKIRQYKIEDRVGLRKVDNIQAWETAYQQYKTDVGVPKLESPVEELSWLLSYAVRLEFLDGQENFENITSKEIQEQTTTNDTTGSDADMLSVEAPELMTKEISPEMEEQLLADPSGSHRKTEKRSKVSPGVVRRRLFRRATYVKNILDAKDPSSLSEKEKNSLAWAIETIAKDALTRPAPKQNAKVDPKDRQPETSRAAENRRKLTEVKRKDFSSKRLRSSEDSKNPPKRSKVADTMLFSGAIRSSLQLAVVDFGKPSGQYSLECGQMIERALARAVFDHIRKYAGATAPKFDKVKWHHGITMIDCKDKLSMEFVKAAVCGFRLWEGAALRAVPPEEIPTTPKGMLCVPDWGVDKNEILDFLKAQNPSIAMKGWEVVGEEEAKNGTKSFIIHINEPPASLLTDKQLNLFYGAGEVTLKLLS